MEVLKIWDGEIPFYDKKINNAENDNLNKIEFYRCCGESDTTVVIFPGGAYYLRSSDHEGRQIAQYYNKSGINAAVVEYRVSPYTYPVPLLDAQRAIKVLRRNADKLGIKNNKIITCGFSAGGHLCSMMATKSDICNIYGDETDKMSARPDGAILCYPVISTDEKIANTDSVRHLLGDKYTELKGEFSSDENVTESTCPCFIWHTADDGCVNVQNSLRFAQALIRNKVKCELHIYPTGPHGVGLAAQYPHLQSWLGLSVKWIKECF